MAASAKVRVFVLAAVALAGSVLVGGCASATEVEAEEEAPVALADGMEASAIVYSADAAGMWSAKAYGGSGEFNMYEGQATFTGPAGATRRMGACALREYRVGGNAVACNTAADCGGAPATLPAGGFRYCVAPNNVGVKTCFYRPGAPSNFCAGTPANGNVPIPAQTLYTRGSGPAGTRWLTYACFEGCTATDPSSSSVAVPLAGCYMCGARCC
jgi:hypothetical protein